MIAKPLENKVNDHEDLETTLAKERQAKEYAEAMLVEKSQELHLSQELLQEMVYITSETDSFTEALQTCISKVCRTIYWEVGHVYMRSDQDKDLLIPTDIWYRPDPESFQSFYDITMETKIPIGIGLPGQVSSKNQPLWIEDVTLDKTFIRNKEGINLGIRGAFGFPIKVDGHTIAVMEFFSSQTAPVDRKLLLIMNGISEQLSRVLERQNNQEKLKEINGQLEKKVQERSLEIINMNRQLTAELTERKELETQLVQSEKMASIGQLAAGVAHEVNNPIGFVTSNMASLEEYLGVFKQLTSETNQLITLIQQQEHTQDQTVHSQELSACVQRIQKIQQQEDLDFILSDCEELIGESRDGLKRVRDIVGNLMDFVRPDEEGVKQTDIHECLESTLKMVSTKMEQHCQVEKQFGNIPTIPCNPSQMNEVFSNMLMNALEAIERTQSKKGVITLKTETEGQENTPNHFVVIRISDTGKGISPENQSKIFDPFFTTKPIGKGTGLGLSMSHGIIQKHGGFLFVDSYEGKGSTFSIYLPVTPADPVTSADKG